MSELKNNLLNIKTEKDTKILPENIKKGITIYNVTGTLEGGSSTTNIVKQFNSIANMQADPSPVEDGLATVYASSEEGITEDTEFQIATFPETVVLDEAIEDYVDVGFQAVDTSIMFDCWGNLDSSRFGMSCYTDNGDIRIEYTSSDGITYTRTNFQKNDVTVEGTEMDFDTVIKFGSRWGSSEFNSVIGNFIKVGSAIYSGLYKYSTEDNRYNLAPTQLSATPETVYTGTFYGSKGVEEGQLSVTNNLNIQQVKNRTNLYSNLSYLELDENVTDLSGVFENIQVSSIPLINTRNVTNLHTTFFNCRNLVDFPEIDMSNIKDYTKLFHNCDNLSNNSLLNIANSLPLGSQVNCIVYNTGLLANRFNTSTRDMLYNKGYLDCDTNTNGWSTQYNINGNLFNRGEDFDRYGFALNNEIKTNYRTANLYLTIKSEGIDNGILLLADDLFGSVFDLVLASTINIQFNTVNLISGLRMFANCIQLKNIYPSTLNTPNLKTTYNMFHNCKNLISAPNFNTINVINMYGMFYNCINLTNIPNFNTINVTDMGDMFQGCSNLTNVPNFDTSNVKSMYGMFYGCNLTTIPNFNTINVTSMDFMFGDCSNLTTIPNFNTSNVTRMGYMFYKCTNLTTVLNFDTSNVTNMGYMFYNCSKLTNIPNFNTINVIDMGSAFGHTNIVNFPNFDLSNVVNMTETFAQCQKIVTLPNFNFTNINTVNYMLANCINLISVPNWNFTNLYDMRGMFSMCRNITTVPNFDTSNVRLAHQIFVYCNNLTTVPNFNFINAITTAQMFMDCYNLQIVPNFDTSNVTNMYGMFWNCFNIQDIPQYNTSNVTNMGLFVRYVNKLSNASIQNIVNMCLNSNVPTNSRNLNTANQYSPFYNTNISNTRYQNRWSELTAAGWTY